MLRVTGRAHLDAAPLQRLAHRGLCHLPAERRPAHPQVMLRECSGVFGAADMERCERDVEQEAGEIVGDQRQQTDRSVSSIRAVLKSLGALDGPKSVILVSEGLVLEGLGGELDDLAQHRRRRPGVARRPAARCADVRRLAIRASDHGRQRPAPAGGGPGDARRHGPRHAAQGREQRPRSRSGRSSWRCRATTCSAWSHSRTIETASATRSRSRPRAARSACSRAAISCRRKGRRRRPRPKR